MFRSFSRIALLLVLMSGSSAHATLKYYQYNGNLPFIEMMLNMMTVMGILDKVPVNYMSDITNNRYNNYYPGGIGDTPDFGRVYNRYGSYESWESPSNIHRAFSCKSILCGNRVQVLNGLWVESNGGMLGIKDRRFLWTGANQSYITGLLQVNKNLILAKVNGVNAPIQYQYKLNNNQLIMRSQNGSVKYFRRVRAH